MALEPNIKITGISMAPNPVGVSSQFIIGVKIDATIFQIVTKAGDTIVDKNNDYIVCKEV